MENLNSLQNQLEFIKEIDKVKYITRKTKLFGSDRHENDAEHSWHLALMAIVLAEHSDEPVDLLKVIKMVLIHDIVEIDAGDIFLYNSEVSHDNTANERLAAERIFGLLPAHQTADLLSVWEEFEEGKTAEAKFARAMDRLEPLLQNLSNNGGTWKEFNVPYEQVYEKKSVIKLGSIRLWKYAEQKINESLNNGLLKKFKK